MMRCVCEVLSGDFSRDRQPDCEIYAGDRYTALR
jgi:hypothetical protein